MSPASGPGSAASELVSIKGELVPRRRIEYPNADLGWMRGYGVYETLFMYPPGRCFEVDAHLDRLADSARLLGIVPPGRPTLARALEAWCQGSGMTRGRVRIVLVLDQDEPWWMIDGDAIPEPRPPVEKRALAMAASRISIPPPPLGSAKTISRVSYELAARQARALGADDALLPTIDGKLGESTRASVFLARGGRLHTPPLSLGILPGVTRQLLLARLPEQGIPVVESVDPFEAIWEADELFVVSTVRGVAPVVRLVEEGGRVRPLAPGPFVRAAEDAVRHEVESTGLAYAGPGGPRVAGGAGMG